MYDDDDRDMPQEADWTPDDASTDLESCSECGEPVYSETQKCPYCGAWIVGGSARGGWKWGIVCVVVILLILSFLIPLR